MAIHVSYSFSKLFSGSSEQPSAGKRNNSERSISSTSQSGSSLLYQPSLENADSGQSGVRPMGDPGGLANLNSSFGFLREGAGQQSAGSEGQKPIATEEASAATPTQPAPKEPQIPTGVDDRVIAYGWSLPPRIHSAFSSSGGGANGTGSGAASNNPIAQVPIPVHCGPLAESECELKLWCAAAVTIAGSALERAHATWLQSHLYRPSLAECLAQSENLVQRELAEGGAPNASSFVLVDSAAHTASGADAVRGEKSRALTQLEHEVNYELECAKANASARECDPFATPLVWFCTSSTTANKSGPPRNEKITLQSRSEVLVVDANSPAKVLTRFTAGKSQLMCIAAVAGAAPLSDLRSRPRAPVVSFEARLHSRYVPSDSPSHTLAAEQHASSSDATGASSSLEQTPPPTSERADTVSISSAYSVHASEMQSITTSQTQIPQTVPEASQSQEQNIPSTIYSYIQLTCDMKHRILNY